MYNVGYNVTSSMCSTQEIPTFHFLRFYFDKKQCCGIIIESMKINIILHHFQILDLETYTTFQHGHSSPAWLPDGLQSGL